MSGMYDLMRFIGCGVLVGCFFVFFFVCFVFVLVGLHLDVLRTRHVTLASSEGKWEDIGESFRMAKTLGDMGIPNWVDAWGREWDHDWVTWREKLPKYLDEWTRPGAS